MVTIGIRRKQTRGIDAPAEEGGCPLIDPLQLLKRQWRRSVLLQHFAAVHTVAHVLVHTWPPKLLVDLAKQLIAPVISQVLMDIRQQLCLAHQRRDVHPALVMVAGRRQKDL